MNDHRPCALDVREEQCSAIRRDDRIEIITGTRRQSFGHPARDGHTPQVHAARACGRNHQEFAVLALAVTHLIPGGSADVGEADAGPHRETLNQYCVVCHSRALLTAGLNLEDLDTNDLEANGVTWEKMLRKLRNETEDERDAAQDEHREERDLGPGRRRTRKCAQDQMRRDPCQRDAGDDERKDAAEPAEAAFGDVAHVTV